MTAASGRRRNELGFQLDWEGLACPFFHHDSFEMSDFGVSKSESLERESRECVRTEAIFEVCAEVMDATS